MGYFCWPCSGHYKKTKKPHRKTQRKNYPRKHRCKDKQKAIPQPKPQAENRMHRPKDEKKAIPQPKPQAENHKHLIQPPKVHWQETLRVKTSLASILALVNFGSWTPSSTMDKQSRYTPEVAFGRFGVPAPRSPELAFRPARASTPGLPSPAGRESSSDSDPKRPQRRPQSTAPVTSTVESYHTALTKTANPDDGGSDTVYIHPHSMSHAQFLVLDYRQHPRGPTTYSALIPTGAQIFDLTAALAPPGARVELWARTDTGCHDLQHPLASPLAGGSLYALFRAACQLEVWPDAARREAAAPTPKPREKTPPPPTTTTPSTTTAAVAAAGERVRKLEKELEEAKKKERDEAKKKARPSRRASLAYPAAAGSSEETSERGAPGRRPVRPAPTGENIWPPNRPATTHRHKW